MLLYDHPTIYHFVALLRGMFSLEHKDVCTKLTFIEAVPQPQDAL
jgi:hypothetical protein